MGGKGSRINPIRQMQVTAGLRAGKSARRAVLDAGYAEASGKNATALAVVKQGMADISKDYSRADIIGDLKDILRLKISVEKKLFYYIDSHKKITPKNLHEITTAINKTKDSITEIGKLLRLYDGDSTENVVFSDDERQQRRSRLSEMFFRSPTLPIQPSTPLPVV